MTPIDTSLLAKVVEKFADGRSLMGSKWQNCETEVIAMQTLGACNVNFEKHGDAFSWLNENCLRGRANCGTDNLSGLNRLIEEGDITVEDYTGELTPPENTAMKNDKPQILRVTNKLIYYAASEVLN